LWFFLSGRSDLEEKVMKSIIVASMLALYATAAFAAAPSDTQRENCQTTWITRSDGVKVAQNRCPSCCTNNCSDCSGCKTK